MKISKLPRRTRCLWQLRIILIDILIALICFYFRTGYKWSLSVGIVILAFSLPIIFWYIPQFIKNYEIRIIDEAIVINSGVIIKSTHIMPFSKMIYAQSITTPIAAKMEITAISLKAARTSVIIPEIRVDEAIALLEVVSKEKKDE